MCCLFSVYFIGILYVRVRTYASTLAMDCCNSGETRTISEDFSFSPSLHIAAYNLQNFAEFRTPPHFVLGFVSLSPPFFFSCIPRFLECKGCFSPFRCLWSTERYVLFYIYDSFHLRSLFRRFCTLSWPRWVVENVSFPARFSQRFVSLRLQRIASRPDFCFYRKKNRSPIFWWNLA